MTIPPGWRIINKDRPELWHTTCYSFTLRRTGRKAARARPARKAEGDLDVDVTTWSEWRARQNGFLTGHRSRTPSGLPGVWQSRSEGQRRERSLTILAGEVEYERGSRAPMAVTVEVFWPSAADHRTERTAYRLLRSLRLLPTRPASVGRSKRLRAEATQL